MTHRKDNKNGLTLSTHFRKEILPQDWISQSEAARLRRVSRQAIARLMKKGRFRKIAIAGRTLLSREDVERYKPERPGRPASEREV